MAHITQDTKQAIKAALDDLKLPKSWKLSLSITHHSSLNVAIMSAPATVLDDYVPTAYQLEDNPGLVVDETTRLYINENNVAISWEGKTRAVLESIIETIKTAGNWFDRSDSQSDYFNIAFYIDVSFGNRRTGKDVTFVGERRTKSDAVKAVAEELGVPVIDVKLVKVDEPEALLAEAVRLGTVVEAGGRHWGETGAGEPFGIRATEDGLEIDFADNVVPLFVRENREPSLAEKIDIARREMIRRYKAAFAATPAGANLNDSALNALAEAALKVTVD